MGMRVQYVCVVNPTDNNDMPIESKEKPKDDRVRVTIHPSIAKKIEDGLPEHQKGRPFSFVVDDLLGEYLKLRVDSRDTLSGPPGHYSYSSNNSLEGLEKSVRKGRETFLTPEWQLAEHFTCHDPKEHEAFLKEQKKIAQKDSPAFQQFWEIYQSAGSKAANQSKAKARIAWKTALNVEKADRLVEAIKKAVIEQARKIGADEFVTMLPDCHRWLRDECFTSLLENHTPTQPERIIPGVTVL
jgi:hypothetical protein